LSNSFDLIRLRGTNHPRDEEQTTPQAIPYLSFNRNCAEAARFYEKVLGADMKALISCGDSPMQAETPKEVHHLIMHAYLVQPDGGALMAGDCPPGMPYKDLCTT
jgi:PhnB protein